MVLPLAVHAQEKVENLHFSIEIPETWSFTESFNTVTAVPGEFAEVLLGDEEDSSLDEKIENGVALAEFQQDCQHCKDYLREGTATCENL